MALVTTWQPGFTLLWFVLGQKAICSFSSLDRLKFDVWIYVFLSSFQAPFSLSISTFRMHITYTNPKLRAIKEISVAETIFEFSMKMGKWPCICALAITIFWYSFFFDSVSNVLVRTSFVLKYLWRPRPNIVVQFIPKETMTISNSNG